MLTEDQVNKIRQTMATSGWNDVVIPAAMNRGKQALIALTLSPPEREKAGGEFAHFDDSLLRAVIKDSEWWVAAFVNEVKMHDYNRRQEELLGQQNGAETPA